MVTSWQPSDVVDNILLFSAGWGPYAYFRMLEETRGMPQAPNAQNGNRAQLAQLTEAQVENQEGQSHHGCMGLTLTGNGNQTSTLEDELESGRR